MLNDQTICDEFKKYSLYKKMKKKLFYLFIIILFPFFEYAENVQNFLSRLPQKDKEELKQLFYFMMMNDHLAYTLFGDKPVSLSGDFKITPIKNINCKMKCGSIFWKRWEVWKKYAHCFPLHDYLLIEENHPYQSIGSIYLINRQAFIDQVNTHLAFFKSILEREISGEGLLKEIESKKLFFPLIKNNSILLGILLGYGFHNAKLFDRRKRLLLFVTDKTVPYQGQFPSLPFVKPMPSAGFSSIEEEYRFLVAHLRPINRDDYSPLIIGPVHFMADLNDQKTKFLKNKYQKLRGEISALYSKGEFLEITLSQLTSNKAN